MRNAAMHTLHTTTGAKRAWCLGLLCACVLVVAALLALVSPSPALAAGTAYSMPEVNIQARVETNGSARIVEQRTFDFSSDCSAIKWQFDGLGEGQTRIINGVRVGRLIDDAIDGDWEVLNSTSFVSSWRDGGAPSQHAYAMDLANDALYTFFGATQGEYVVEIDYTIYNFAAAYEDTAEISWRYLTSSWPAASENVTVTVSLPLPLDAEVTPGQNVRAWGHGPASGNLSVSVDGSIVCKTDCVQPGQFADVHILFPDEWLTNLNLRSIRLHSGQWKYDAAIQSETQWVDSWVRNAMYGTEFDLVCLGLGVLCLVAIMLVYLRWGRKPKAPADEQAQDAARVQAATLEEEMPEVAIRLLRWNHWSNDDLSFAQGVSETSDMHEINAWQEALNARVRAEGLFDERSYKARNALLILAAACVAVGVLLWQVTGGRTTPLVVGFVCAIAAALVANYTPRLTQKGENIMWALMRGADDDSE